MTTQCVSVKCLLDGRARFDAGTNQAAPGRSGIKAEMKVTEKFLRGESLGWDSRKSEEHVQRHSHVKWSSFSGAWGSFGVTGQPDTDREIPFRDWYKSDHGAWEIKLYPESNGHCLKERRQAEWRGQVGVLGRSSWCDSHALEAKPSNMTLRIHKRKQRALGMPRDLLIQ